MRILVTGGAGFLGSHLVDALVADGHQVFVLDDLSNGSLTFLPKGITLFERSIAEDLTPVFTKAQPEVVFHLAAQIDVRRSLENPKSDAQLNIIGTLNLLEACRQFKCKRFIFASTAGVYGDTEQLPTPENAQCRPENPYAITKLAIENYLYVYRESYGISSCILRYSNAYGPRQAVKGEGGVVAVFIKTLLKGAQCTINGDGNQTRDLIYVKDVVEANLVALHKKLEGTYNVATQTQTTVNALHALLAKQLDFPWKAQHGLPIKGEIYHSSLQIDKISPYWKPKYTLERGLAETVEWFRAHK
jgi:UDP-glucose 4-epimerase